MGLGLPQFPRGLGGPKRRQMNHISRGAKSAVSSPGPGPQTIYKYAFEPLLKAIPAQPKRLPRTASRSSRASLLMFLGRPSATTKQITCPCCWDAGLWRIRGRRHGRSPLNKFLETPSAPARVDPWVHIEQARGSFPRALPRREKGPA